MIKSYHIRMDEELLKRLKYIALDRDTSVHQLIMKAIDKEYHKPEKKVRTSVRKKRKRKKSVSE